MMRLLRRLLSAVREMVRDRANVMADLDKTERLDAVPLRLRVRVTKRPIYGCRSCAEAVVQAPAPDSAVSGGLPTEGRFPPSLSR